MVDRSELPTVGRRWLWNYEAWPGQVPSSGHDMGSDESMLSLSTTKGSVGGSQASPVGRSVDGGRPPPPLSCNIQ